MKDVMKEDIEICWDELPNRFSSLQMRYKKGRGGEIFEIIHNFNAFLVGKTIFY